MQCIAAALANVANWHTSSFSPHENCVDVGDHAGIVFMRDSKDDALGPVIPFGVEQWAIFLSNATGLSTSSNGVVEVIVEERHTVDARGRTSITTHHVRTLDGLIELHFTDAEWLAFQRGVEAGEFSVPATEFRTTAVA